MSKNKSNRDLNQNKSVAVTEEDNNRFEKLMKALKVKPLPTSSTPQPQPPKKVDSDPISFSPSDQDPFPPGEVTADEKYDGLTRQKRKASRRKIKVNRKFKPDDSLDLHGKTQVEAVEITSYFIQSAKRKQARSLLIITGKGTHSGEDGAVIRKRIERWLRQNERSLGFRFQIAPSHLGGNGAFLIFLNN